MFSLRSLKRPMCWTFAHHRKIHDRWLSGISRGHCGWTIESAIAASYYSRRMKTIRSQLSIRISRLHRYTSISRTAHLEKRRIDWMRIHSSYANVCAQIFLKFKQAMHWRDRFIFSICSMLVYEQWDAFITSHENHPISPGDETQAYTFYAEKFACSDFSFPFFFSPHCAPFLLMWKIEHVVRELKRHSTRNSSLNDFE